MLNQYIDKMQREVHLGIWNLINVVQLYLCGLRYHSPLLEDACWKLFAGHSSSVDTPTSESKKIYIYIYIYMVCEMVIHVIS